MGLGIIDDLTDLGGRVSARATKRLRTFRAQTLLRGPLPCETSESISRANASTGSAEDFAYFVDRPRFIL